MERTIKSKLSSNTAVLATFQSALVSRSKLFAGMMGTQSFEGNRDLYKALGYMENIQYADYYSRYKRQDIAKAVIDRPAKATWQGPLFLQESSESDETELEKIWKELDTQLGLKTIFSRVDRVAGIGCYGILLLGLDDVHSQDDFKKPVEGGARKLLYLKPLGEGSARVSTYETETKNPRYGLPLMYIVNVINSTLGSVSGGTTTTAITLNVEVHYTRVIHIIDDILENEVLGIPKLEVVFNRLMDLEKIVGGDAEMFWKSARPGYQGILNDDYTMDSKALDDLKNQIDEYENDLRRILVNKGIKYEALTQEMADPTNHVDVQLQMISAVTGIPKRILTGTERGELSSAQDASEWKSFVTGRRLDHAEPHIVRPFVDCGIKYGFLPKPKIGGTYEVVWSDLYALSEAEKVKIGMDRSTALKNYTSSPTAEAVVSPKGFRELFLGLDDNQITMLDSTELSEIEKEQLSISLNPIPPDGGSGVPDKTKLVVKKPVKKVVK